MPLPIIVTYDSLRHWFFSILNGLLSFVLLFALLGIALRITTWLIRRAVERRKYLMRGWEAGELDRQRTESITRVLMTAARAIFGLLAIVLILGSFGVNLGAILASVSLVSIALGFGAQYLVRDYLSGILILAEDQYRVGDSVEINKISGVVDDMRLRLTVLRDSTGTIHQIPNGEIRVVSNRSRVSNRIDLRIELTSVADASRTVAIIEQIGADLSGDPDWKKWVREAIHAGRVEPTTEQAAVIDVTGEATPGKIDVLEGELRRRLGEALAGAGIDAAITEAGAT